MLFGILNIKEEPVQVKYRKAVGNILCGFSGFLQVEEMVGPGIAVLDPVVLILRSTGNMSGQGSRPLLYLEVQYGF